LNISNSIVEFVPKSEKKIMDGIELRMKNQENWENEP
jgi:hypothetical protein